MKRDGHDNVNFFTGTEIEHSPAHGFKTLFVVGVQDVNMIQYHIDMFNNKSREPISHVYFGANMSFPTLDVNDAKGWKPWEQMIRYFLDKMYWCTLDLDPASVEGLVESGLNEHALFIPMISVKLPYIQQLGYNATIKLDDKDFNATNAGVWCHSLHDLLNRKQFTSWSAYTKDQIV